MPSEAWGAEASCSSLREQCAAKTRRPAWRVRVPDIAVSFRDGVCGPQTERLAETCGDFIVRRSDGVYAYQLAVGCDDALGSVTEVVRGSDLLGSTARQLWLFSVFGYPAPQYYHVPLLVAPDGRRLSKRERDLDMEALRARCTPEQLVGRLAQLVGLQPGPEPVRAADLVSRFSWERIPRGEIVIPANFSDGFRVFP